MEKQNTLRIFMHIRNMNNYININKKINNMNQDTIVKYTFGTMAATLLVMNVCAFGVIIVNGIISLI